MDIPWRCGRGDAGAPRYNFGVITGTTSPSQVEECVAAFLLEPLPAEVNAAIDKVHERFRSPTAGLADKDELLAAPWVSSCATLPSCAVS